MKIDKRFTIIILLAVLVKLTLFSYAVIKVPQSKFLIDSSDYLQTAKALATRGVFARLLANGTPRNETFRTPGYPLFLAIFHFLAKVPLEGIILLQIVLTFFAVLLTYGTALLIDQRLGYLSAVIMLFDPSITVYSMMILTESLFLFFMSLFLYLFVVYLKYFKVKWLVASAVILAGATYIRPIAYYLGLVMAVFIIVILWRSSLKKCLIHAVTFIIIVYALIGMWHYRNYRNSGVARFSSVASVAVNATALVHSYKREGPRRTPGMGPFAYYLNMSSRGLLDVLTRPVSLKYFGSDSLKKVGKVLSYPFNLFWLAGLIIGMVKIQRERLLYFILTVTVYFVGVTVAGAFMYEGPRFRVPMMPFIAILSAYGWSHLANCFKSGNIIVRN